jgi:hypothetical protein
VYYTACTVLSNHAPFSFSTATSLQHGAFYIRYRLRSLFGNGDSSLYGILSQIKEFYTDLECTADPTADGLSYPVQQSSAEGMEIRLRSVAIYSENVSG